MGDNIYEDLDNYERLAEYDELKEENSQLHKCVRELEEKISQLTEDNAKMTERLTNIERNFAALLNTAKAEIDRKTEMIATLNMEKDQLIFRHIGNRNNPLNRRFSRNFDRQPQPTKRKLERPPSVEKKIPRLETQRDVRDTEIMSDRFEENVDDENRNPTAIKQDNDSKQTGVSVRPDTPRFSSGDESYGSNNNHMTANTRAWNSPEYLVPESTKEEDLNVAQEIKPSGQNVNDRRKTEELKYIKDVEKYNKNVENRIQYIEKEDLTYHHRSFDRYEGDCKSSKKSSREADDRYYENSRFERIKRDGRIPRSKYREETKSRYNKSRTRPRHDKFDKCRRSRSQSPSLSLGSRNDRRPSKHSRETYTHSTNDRDLRKRSLSHRRIKRRSVEKHWPDKTEHRRDRSYERSHSRNRETRIIMSPKRRTQFVPESIETEDAKSEYSREDTYCRTNQKYNVKEQENRESVNLLKKDYTAEKYNRDKTVTGMPTKFTNEGEHQTRLAQAREPNKGRCRTNSYSKFDTLNIHEMNGDIRICQSPDEADGGYKGSPYDLCAIIQDKGILSVFDDPRLYNERYFRYEDIERHKYNKHSDVKELETLNIRSRTVYLRLLKYEVKSEVTITPQETTKREETPIPQGTLVPLNTIILQETVLSGEPIIPQEIIKQQNTVIPQHTIVSLETSTKKPKTKNDLSDEAIKQIYLDIDSHTSEASLESGELEDSFYITEEIEKPSRFAMELQSSTTKNENIESTNLEPRDATVKHEVETSATMTPPINKSASPNRNKIQSYKIPKLRSHKQNSGTRKDSENQCKNLSTEINKRKNLETKNEIRILDSKSESVSLYSNEVNGNPECQKEKSNTIADNILTLLGMGSNQDLQEQNKCNKNLENKVRSNVKGINKNSEIFKPTNNCESNSKPNKGNDSKVHKENFKKSAKNLIKFKSSVSNYKTDNAELVENTAHEVKQSHIMDTIGKEKDTSIVKKSITSDNLKKHIDHPAENEMQMDCDNIKLSDLRKRKDHEREKKSKDTKSKSSHNLKKDSSRGKRSSKTSKCIDNYVKSSNLADSPLISLKHSLSVTATSATKIDDLKLLKNTTDQRDTSERTPETPETEKRRKTTKHKSKKKSKPDTSSLQCTSKSEDEHTHTQSEEIHNKLADKAKKEIFINQMTDLFGENSLITPEDLLESRDKSFQTPNYPENELDLFMDEKVEKNICHPENTESKITLGILAQLEYTSVTLVKENIDKIDKITTVSREEENSIEKKINEKNVEAKIKGLSTDNEIPGMNMDEQASITRVEACSSSIPKHIQDELKNTENCESEKIVQNNLQARTKAQDPTLEEEESEQLNLNGNQTSRDMPSIFGVQHNEKKNKMNCVSTRNRDTVEHCSNFLLKGCKNSDSDAHTDSDCEPPRFLTSTPNPNMSPPYCQKDICLHSPVKETSHTYISEQSNTVTGPKEDSMQSTRSVQATFSQPQANEPTVVGPPTQRLIIVRKRRRVIVKDP